MDISIENSWTCLKKGNFERESEFLLMTEQNGATKNKYVKAKIAT